MIEIIPFDRRKLEDFIYDGVENGLSGGRIIEIADYYNSLGTAYIGKIGERIIGVGGVYPLWNDWGTAWLFLNKDAKYHPYGVLKGILERMNELIKLYDIKILGVQCLDDSLEANKLLNHLGFVKNKSIKMALYGKKI